LNDSIKLIGKLIEQEPYHPSISIMQAEIKRLEQRHRLKATFSIDFSKVDELSGVEFENLLLDKFAEMGFKAESTPKTGDFGADLIVENKEGTRIIVQCKRFKSKVNLKAVQEVVGAMGHYAGDFGVVITNNSFLNSAVKLAESHDIELWDGDKLVSFLAGDLSFSEIISTFE
jgi:HJR/Mrr/RecB family endonuclease